MKNFILKLSVILTFISAVVLIAIGFKSSPESKSGNGISAVNSPPASLNPHTDFINAIFNAHYKPEEHKLHVSPWLNYIKDSLYFNSVQVYGGAQTNGSQRYGIFGQTLDTGTQVPNMKGLMDSVSDNQLKGIYGRINIEKMCYGQRLEYEISNVGSSTVNDGFCYQNVMSDVYTTDGVRTVLKPEPGSDTAGMLCENIYENFQHTDLYDFVQNDAGTWFVKPVMKIDSGLVDTDPAREIVRIKVTNYTGDTIISVILRARNFLDNNGNYDGSYLDKYKFDFNLDSLQVSGGSENSSELGYGISPYYWEWESNSKIDFKVEWLGQAEVWFDKMIVDDEISDKLFDSNPQANYDSYIIQEVESFTSHSSNYAFFTDELVYSNIPCVKYVKEKMNSGSLTPKFTFATSNYLNIRGLKNDNSEGYKRLLEEVQPDYFSNDAHLIPADFPNNMPHPSLTLVFLAASFSSYPPPGWYQQTLPVNKIVTDIFFIDSIKGWAVTEWAPQFDTGYILNTTNGGDKWNVQFKGHLNFNVLSFPNDSTGYAGGGDGFPVLYKTVNEGLNWQLINSPPVHLIADMYFVNKDTGWICDDDILFGGLYKTTDGALTWTRQLNESYKIKYIFFINNDTGWAAGRFDGISSKLYRTINGGTEWNLQYTFAQQINDIYFFNEFTGIASSGFSYKSTDGGFSWVLTNDGGIELSFGTDSVGWAGNNNTTIIRTTTAGSSWYRQTTNISNPSVSAFDDLTAWGGGSGIVHTTNGGLTSVESIVEIPNKFTLHQNYPNPFNPETKIRYELGSGSNVNLIVYDITGRVIKKLSDQYQPAGEYSYIFDGSGLPSGVYFYKLEAGDFNQVKRMVMLK